MKKVDLERAAKSRKALKDIEARGVDLRDAKLSKLSVTFGKLERAKLDRAKWMYGLVSDCDLNEASLRESDWLKTSLWQTWFDDCDATKASFYDTRITFCTFRRADLTGADLRYTQIEGGTFEDATLTGAFFQNAKGKEVSFERVKAQNVSFENAGLPSSSWKGADLRGAVFSGANLSGCDFRGCQLEGADFENAVLEKARFSGRPPDPKVRVRPQPPQVLLAGHLAKDRVGEAIALFDAWPVPEYRDSALDELRDKETRPRAGTALLARALATPEPRVQFIAAIRAWDAADAGWDLSSLVEPLTALLDARPVQRVPRHTGEARMTMQIGLYAAAVLGRIGTPKALAPLEAGLSGSALEREHCAGGLTIHAIYAKDESAIDRRFAAKDPRVQTGVIRALEAAWLHLRANFPLSRERVIKRAQKAAKAKDRTLATEGRKLLRYL